MKSENRIDFGRIAKEEFSFSVRIFLAPLSALLAGFVSKWAEVREDAERITPESQQDWPV